MTWADGWGSQLRLEGSARDAVTIDSHDAPETVASAATRVGIGPNRTIEDIATTPDRARIGELVGCRGGGYLRAALDQVLPGERESGHPLYLLLDEISGTSLIAGFAWSRWREQWVHLLEDEIQRPDMEGVCIGFAPGSSALEEHRTHETTHRVQRVVPLIHIADPHGWHDLADLPDVSMRRARRIDVWLDGDQVMIDSSFQDSAGDAEHGRVAVHEYGLTATADLATGTLTTVEADPRVLPFRSCPAARATADVVVGSPLADLRQTVLERLAKTNGCTHLNDALRALAEVPVLVSRLEAHLAS